jgi:tetratricopeptide (TPR) repeat protein
VEDDAPRPEPGVDEAAAWDKLKRLAEKHRASDDPDISKALEAALVAEAQSLALTAATKPAWLENYPLIAGFFQTLPDPSIPTSPTSPTTLTDTPKQETQILTEEPLPNDIEAAERLIREAHLYTMRGDKARARELLEQAEKAAPRAPSVLVALGDAAMKRGNLKEATRLYGLAKDLEAKNVAYERKHAEAIFRQSQGLIFDPTARPGTITDAASAKAAVVMSFMVPGLGQIVTGETGKGLTFLVVFAGCVIAIAMMGLNGLFSLFGMHAEKAGSQAVILPIAIGLVDWVAAIIDASSKAKRSERPRIIHPTPPADLPFE